MEENKFEDKNPFLFGTFDQEMVIDEEKNSYHAENYLEPLDEEQLFSSYGDSGFDELRPLNCFDQQRRQDQSILPLNNKLLNALLSEDSEAFRSRLQDSHEFSSGEKDVLEFFTKGSTKKSNKTKNESQDYLKSSTENNSNTGNFGPADSNSVMQKHENHKMSEIAKQKQKDVFDKLKEKKRVQKRKRKTCNEFNQESDSLGSAAKSPTSCRNIVAPQKRKGTIWKILFPTKSSDDLDNELERLVCTQVEHQISRDPGVIKSFEELKRFENSKETEQISKSEYTKKKNRISAQLSRERREAIMHSLINVCIGNIKAKKELDADIDEVKQVLKATLCHNCSSKLKGTPVPEACRSTLDIQKSGTAKLIPKKRIPGIVVHRPGSWGLLMSFAVIACVLSVAFMSGKNPNTSDMGTSDVGTEVANSRYLREDTSMFQDIMDHMPDEDRDSVPDLYIKGMISKAKQMYLNKDTDIVENNALYKNLDMEECYKNSQSMSGTYNSIQDKIRSIKNSTLPVKEPKLDSGTKIEDSDNVPATIKQVAILKSKGPTVYFGNSEILSDGKLRLDKDGCGTINVWMSVKDLADNLSSTEFLNSLGFVGQGGVSQNRDNFIEFKCAINGINIVSSKADAVMKN